MAEAVIVEAVRSPVGKRNGGLSGVHPGELSAQVSMVSPSAQASIRRSSTTSSGAVSCRPASRRSTSAALRCWRQVGRKASPE